jgi:DNA mismatch endonuclease (patch repair protein)
MRAVKSKRNRSTEHKLIALMKNQSICGWRRNYPVKGKPDFVFLNQKIAVFVDGCFWHGHDCRNLVPATNSEYWQRKIGRNKRRDKIVGEKFEARGWKVVRIWECELAKGDISKLETKLSHCVYK